jgi:hypothetical protein
MFLQDVFTRQDIAEILLKLALNTNQSNSINQDVFTSISAWIVCFVDNGGIVFN